MRVGAILFFISRLGAQAAAGLAVERVLKYSGEAKARHSGTFLYTERHFLVYRDDRLVKRVVLYLCQAGSAFARKIMDYSDLAAPDFTLDDKSNGMREGLSTAGQQRVVFFRGNLRQPEKQKSLPPIPGLVADAGFDEFIRAQWGGLMTGKAVAPASRYFGRGR